MSNFSDVGDFHEKFGLHRSDKEPGIQEISDELLDFRIKFLREELDEFCEGEKEGDHAKMFDALLDLVYVAMGTAHLLGYPWQMGWDAVQKANMAKERAASDGSNSKRGSSFDVVKPEGWTPPNIDGILTGILEDESVGACPVCGQEYVDEPGPYDCRPGFCKGAE